MEADQIGVTEKGRMNLAGIERPLADRDSHRSARQPIKRRGRAHLPLAQLIQAIDRGAQIGLMLLALS